VDRRKVHQRFGARYSVSMCDISTIYRRQIQVAEDATAILFGPSLAFLLRLLATVIAEVVATLAHR
jgi:hypothetical protein